jgi:aminoglycoside phosphotransferase (APT) family kinase protein
MNSTLQNHDEIVKWLDAHGIGHGPISDVTLLAGGTQNRLYRFRRGDESFVLRRPPEHKRDNSDETMRRESRLLAALAQTDVPHPRLIAAEHDVSVIGDAFYVMHVIDGFNPNVEMPDLHQHSSAVQKEMGESMIDGIAALSRVHPDHVGLSDFGKAANWIERQVSRWQSHLDSYSAFPNYKGPDIGNVARVGKWLTDNQPPSMQVGIIHGDYHFSNVMFRYDSGQLAAIVDWELATIGDPLLDLGHLMACWPGAIPVSVAGNMSVDVGEPEKLINRYADITGRDMAWFPWFRVLAPYRLGIILEGTNARADAGLAPRDIGDTLHAMTVGLIALAEDLIDRYG